MTRNVLRDSENLNPEPEPAASTVTVPDLVRLELVIDVDNAASIRVAEKAGAVFEGVLRNRVEYSGAPRPARMYSMVPEDLAASR